jgi:hypothetical protein
VFARSEFDFGDLTALEHRIDTGLIQDVIHHQGEDAEDPPVLC